MSKALETQVWSNKDPKNNLLLGFELTGKEAKMYANFLYRVDSVKKNKEQKQQQVVDIQCSQISFEATKSALRALMRKLDIERRLEW